MSALKFACVAVEGLSYHFDKPYGYLIPDNYEQSAVPGVRVIVPFGRGNRRRPGIIVRLEENNRESVLKPIFQVVDAHPLITDEMIQVAFFIKERTFCTLYEALKLAMPAGINLRVIKNYRIGPQAPEETRLLNDDERKALDFVRRSRLPVTREKLLKALGLDVDSALPEQLIEKGILAENDGIEDRTNEASVRMVRLGISEEEALGYLESNRLTMKQKRAVKTILEAGAAAVRELSYFSGVTASVINTLVKKGIFEQYDLRVYRNPYGNLKQKSASPTELSHDQQAAFEDLYKRYRQGASASLLYGVTGSGKTQVFMKLIERVREDGRGVIVLVPEISLTPQAVERFYARFGSQVAVLHSGLSVGERVDEWQRVQNGQAGIVVGTRSAVFAPVSNLGLIIMDEEQEHTYKSESSPRFHARDIARFRCAYKKAMLLLASATPAVESFYAAQMGRYALTRLDKRYGDAVLPKVITVDMKEELTGGNDGPVSGRLLKELQENLAMGEQSILLLNRRGYNTFVSCAGCGHVMTCPSCSIALTYHSANGRLMCHYCGYSTESVSVCPECGGKFMRYAGSGTQKAEQILSDILPEAKILRMDTDTTTTKYSHEKILKKFEQEKYDILIGTQMVAKGLDFSNVTLVGVLSADQTLYLDDFRAAERTFSLLTQVIGRAGRGSLRGRAVIQTQTPENEVIRLAARQDYDAFYRSEITLRKALLYPPFCDICEIGFTGISEREVAAAAAEFFRMLRDRILAEKGMPARLMTPSPAAILKISSRYRYRVLLKCRNDKRLRALLAELLTQFGKNKSYQKVSVFIDINPLTVL